MIYIPANKALVAVKKGDVEKSCADCDLAFDDICQRVVCDAYKRIDGNDVIFKLVDYKFEEAR